jgi:hypothetical protein
MLSSITPLGERGRGTSWRGTVTAFIAGSTLSGAALGAVVGTLGRALPSWPAVPLLLGSLCIAGIAIDRGLGGLRLPTLHRQVDESWLGIYRGWVYGIGYGVQLGLGVGTIVVTSAVYVMIGAELLAGSAASGVLIGAIFGAVRGSTVLLGRGARDQRGLMRLHSGLERSRDRVFASAQAAVALAGIAGLVAGVR